MYTWRDGDTGFDPGALDRVIYTDSVLSIKQSIVPDTTTISAEEIFGGKSGYFDHLPLIVDFSVRSETAASHFRGIDYNCGQCPKADLEDQP